MFDYKTHPFVNILSLAFMEAIHKREELIFKEYQKLLGDNKKSIYRWVTLSETVLLRGSLLGKISW